jgi:hypothetical protein
MKPVNNKSLLHFIFDQMEKLDNNDISVEQAKAQGGLAKQANNALKYELDRAKTILEVDKYNKENDTALSVRNPEGTNF